jgi:hypothetical protein
MKTRKEKQSKVAFADLLVRVLDDLLLIYVDDPEGARRQMREDMDGVHSWDDLLSVLDGYGFNGDDGYDFVLSLLVEGGAK